MEPVCEHCGSVIEVKRARDRHRRFCGRRCVSLAHANIPRRRPRTVPTEPCPTCGVAVRRISDGGRRRRFCSRSCANKSRSVDHERTCAGCGAPFLLPNISYERRGAGRFCSRSCASRQYTLDERFFAGPLNPCSAYWLGFLMADGGVYRGELVVNLKRGDAEHLHRFKAALSAGHPIQAHGITASIRIGSRALCADLAVWGCLPAKSLTLQWPKLDPDLEKHFVRGFFDGDGSISQSKKWWRMSFYGASTPFMDALADWLERNEIRTTRPPASEGRVVHVRAASHQTFADMLYKGTTTFLSRKHARFKQAGLV